MKVVIFLFCTENVVRTEEKIVLIHNTFPENSILALIKIRRQLDAVQNFYKILNLQITFSGGGGERECLTCSLIQMGSSMAYGDNTCPQCGAKCGDV